MRLHRQAVEYFGPFDIVTEPAVTGAWEASFDAGATWTAGTADGAGWKWLVAGPDADDPGSATVISNSVSPLGRHSSNPENIIRDDFPRVTLYP